MPEQKSVEYVFACARTNAEQDALSAVLNLMPEAQALYAAQGRITVRVELKDEDSTTSTQGA